MSKQANAFLPRIRLNPKVDQDIIQWLASLDESGYGRKGLAIKEALRKAFNTAQAETQPPSQNTSVFSDKNELLADIRRIVEASLEGLQLAGVKNEEDFDSETESILDNFASLMI